MIVDVVKNQEFTVPKRPRKKNKRRAVVDREIFEAGYKYKVEAKCPVLDFETKLEKEVVLAYSPEHFSPEFSDEAAFNLNTSFGEAGTMSCGFIHIKKAGCKPNKNSGKHALVFF